MGGRKGYLGYLGLGLVVNREECLAYRRSEVQHTRQNTNRAARSIATLATSQCASCRPRGASHKQIRQANMRPFDQNDVLQSRLP